MIFLAVIAFVLISQLMLALASRFPPETRGLLTIGAMALLMFPLGFICGRDSGREDQAGKIARASLVVMLVAVCVGIITGCNWAMLGGLGAGYSAGYVFGRLTWKRIQEVHGDTVEADQVLNVLVSEHIPPKEHPCEAYLKNQDQPTRQAISMLRFSEVLILLIFLGLGAWLAFSNCLYTLSRVLYVHPGDGTLYFMSTDSIVIGIPMILLCIYAFAVTSEFLMPVLAGVRRDVWLEFKSLREKKRGSTPNRKSFGPADYVFLAVLFSVLVLFMDSYFKVTYDGVYLNRFWGLGAKFHPWTDIRTVDAYQEKYTCRKCDGRHQRFHARIVFADGSEWKPYPDCGRQGAKIEESVRYIASRKQ
ncbi:MAG: hypothetical protein ACYC08_03960 [Armatimonadota bacterium]